MKNVAVIGAGQFGTAISNSLAINRANKIKIFSLNENKIADINNNHKNSVVYPNTILSRDLTGSSDFSELIGYDVIFLAIPSYEIFYFILKNKPHINDGALIVNLAKGLISSNKTVVEGVKEVLPNCDVVSMKGPTFSIELLNGANSLFTFAYHKNESYHTIRSITSKTNIFLDFSFDILGVELLSVLKNVYAISLGYIDAKYNSSNTRFLILTIAFKEIKILLNEFGCNPDTIDLACGFGDLGLTSLNDLSRNRTLGLLMGKGFYNSNENKVVLEGVRSIQMVSELISPKILDRLPLFSRIKRAFDEGSGIIDIDFKDFIMQKEKRVITYGTFDLLHYGHLEILSRAKNLGTELIVGLSTDNFNETKGKKSIHSYEKRKKFLESLSYVSKVIPENNWSQKINDIKENNIDLLVMTDDWKEKFEDLKKYCEVHYLSITAGVSTTQLKRIIQ